MKVLITGESGYVSNELYNYIKLKRVFNVSKKSVRLDSLDSLNLEGVDIVIHTAAIVHKKESNLSSGIYFNVNTYLTDKLANKAKKAGVKHFIFLSTMAVYGDIVGEINELTIPKPKSLYGKSKLAAEEVLKEVQDETFVLSIIRPPMVYGYNCPGNYKSLSKMSKFTKFFPQITNYRSMIFIGNLVEFIYQLIINRDSGVFHPQDKQFVMTSNMVKEICICHKKKVIFNELLGKIIKRLFNKKAIYQKVFGDLHYSHQLSRYRDNSYQVYNFKEAILISEKGLKDEKNN